MQYCAYANNVLTVTDTWAAPPLELDSTSEFDVDDSPAMVLHFRVIRDGFLIRRSSAIRRFIAGFLKCDSRTIMKSFLKKITSKLTENLHKNPTKFPENSQAIFFEKRIHYCTIIAPQESCEKPANRRAASDEKPTPGSVSVASRVNHGELAVDAPL